MRKYELTVNGRSFSIAVRRFSSESAELEVNGTPYRISIDEIVSEGGPPPRPAPLSTAKVATRGAAPAAPAAGEAGSLTAPIPGQITELFVKEGEQVLAGEPVLKMEAMKMENVIRATAGGTVRALRVKTGDVVSQGQELMVIG